MRKLLNPHQKAKVALAALRGDKTFSQLSGEHQVHSSQISGWKGALEKNAHLLFNRGGPAKEEVQIAELKQLVGQRDLEIEWLKKKLPHPDA